MNVQNNAYANKSRHTYILTLEKTLWPLFMDGLQMPQG